VAPLDLPASLTLAHPQLAAVGNQPVHLEQYNQLLEGRS
jgi:hypothetical protein